MKKPLNFLKTGMTLFLLVLLCGFFPAKADEINYTLSMSEPHTHYFEVDMEVDGLRQRYTDLKMPVWAPGSYLVREFAKGVEGFKAEDADGTSLKVEKINKNTWRVYNSRADFTASYKVYSYEMSVRTSFLDATHGYLNGTSIFMYVDGEKDQEATLKVEPYEGWSKVSTALEPVSGQKFTFKAPNYDKLADSPIEIGNHETFEFEAAGVKHTVAMYGEGNYEVEKLKTDMAKVVEACTDVFGENPNDNYLFIIHNLTRGSGGLEHLNSTTLQVNRWTYQGSAYTGFLSLVAHEYFHLWNVKRLRPEALGPFNYDEENYTHLLWVMEGFTSYYDELLLSRADIKDDEYYVNKLAGGISYVENQPGNRVQPVAMASFDAWIKAYRPNENSYNTTISYYSKGALIASMLDLQIIENTQGEKNLDDVMQYLYKEYYKKEGRGVTNEEVQQAVERVAGKDMDEFFNKYIWDTETIDYQKYLDYVGLELIDRNAGNQEAYLGTFNREDGGRLIVRTVPRNTAAYKGGLNVDDEIIAADGFRVDADELNKIVGMKQPGDDIVLTISRDNIVQEITITLEENKRMSYTIQKVSNPTDEQKKLYEQWVGEQY